MSFGQWASDCLGVPLEERFNFNPLTYFLYSGIDGAWLDASDMSTMYQGAAGTTPVTAMEQPVGLWLDKSQGLQLGPELVNGGYTTMPTYDNITTILSGSSFRSVCVTSANRVYFNLSTVVGKTYLLTCICTEQTVSPLSIFARDGFNGSGNVITSASNILLGQKVSFYFNATTTSSCYLFVGAAGSTYAFGSISVRELKGNHATQSITASRPAISARKNLLLASDVLSTQNVTTVAAQQTLSFTGTGSVTLSGKATGTLTGTGTNNRVSLPFTPTAGTLTLTVSGDVRLGQLEYGPVATRYQRVNTATDYDTAGFPRYLKFDGVDDYLSLPYMGLYANGSASVITGSALLRQTTNACTLSEGNTADADSLYCMTRQLASGGNLDSIIVRDDATTLLDTTGSASALADGVTSILSFVDSGTNVKFNKNSQQLTSDSYSRSGVVTLNNTVIGAKVGTAAAMFNNLMLYGLIITKSALSDTDRRKCEVYLGRKYGVQL